MYETDKLPAISGYAHHMHSYVGGAYLEEIWERDLVPGLLWTRAGFLVVDCRRPTQKRAPSWSWATLDGQIYYWSKLEWYNFGKKSQCLNILKYNVILEGLDPMSKS